MNWIKILAVLLALFAVMSGRAQPIAAGWQQSLFVCEDGVAMACGSNLLGQLGIGANHSSHPLALPVVGGSNVISVAGGLSHSLFLKEDGTVWACGSDVSGTLGNGSGWNSSDTLIQVIGLTNVVAITAGEDFSLFLKGDGTAWGCGDNYYGQLGDGTTIDRDLPVQVAGLSDVVAIAAGSHHSLFVKSNGTAWSCGAGYGGGLGNGSTTHQSTAGPVSGLTGVVAVEAGWYFSLFLENDGTAWACGGNGFGNLGIGNTDNQVYPVEVSSLAGIVSIAVGTAHTLFMKNDGTVWGCGGNGWGALGDGGAANEYIEPIMIDGITDAVAIAAGTHSLFLLADGTVKACGYNVHGELGNGTTMDTSIVVPVSSPPLCPVWTSVDEPEMEPTMTVMPNPSTGHAVLILAHQVDDASLAVFDLSGRVVHRADQVHGQEILIVLDHASSGLYVIHLTEKGRSFAVRLEILR